MCVRASPSKQGAFIRIHIGAANAKVIPREPLRSETRPAPSWTPIASPRRSPAPLLAVKHRGCEPCPNSHPRDLPSANCPPAHPAPAHGHSTGLSWQRRGEGRGVIASSKFPKFPPPRFPGRGPAPKIIVSWGLADGGTAAGVVGMTPADPRSLLPQPSPPYRHSRSHGSSRQTQARACPCSLPPQPSSSPPAPAGASGRSRPPRPSEAPRRGSARR